MRLNPSRRDERALTAMEVLLILVSLFILVATLTASLNAPRIRKDVSCVNHLRQIGQGFRVWEGDHQDKFPMAFSDTNRPASQSAEAIFQTLSNQLSSPRLLVCPTDKSRHPARDFTTPLTANNLSYFVNLDASESNPQDILIGDDNFEVRGVRVKSGLFNISSNTPVAWSVDRHRFRGNIGMADGSVQGVNNLLLSAYFHLPHTAPLRLAIP